MLSQNLNRVVSFVVGLCMALRMVHNSPILDTDFTDDKNKTRSNHSCITIDKPEYTNCTICYDSACQITYEEALASFGHLFLSEVSLHNNTLFSGLDELLAIVPQANSSHCPIVDPPAREAEYGCMYVPSMDPDGCATCYTYACWHCNNSDSQTVNISVEIELLPNHDSGSNPIRVNSKLKIAAPDHCPPVAPHSNDQPPDSQDCIYVPQRGADGCIQSYSLVCPQKPAFVNSAAQVTTKTPSTPKCPPVKPPVNKTAAGCVYAERYDNKGCVIAYDMICSTPLAGAYPAVKPPSNQKLAPQLTNAQLHSGPFDWRWMLGDSYKGLALKDARKFRPRASLAVPSSGRFVACKRQSDCFPYREPKEWCSAAISNSSMYAWTDKSCYCANDTEKRACLIERVNMRTKMVEWTFCSPKKGFSCS